MGKLFYLGWCFREIAFLAEILADQLAWAVIDERHPKTDYRYASFSD